jgi:hypothetical protein
MGFGVQSVTVAAMACLGDLPRPDFAVFADPQWEGARTYSYARWFTAWAAERGLRIITAKSPSHIAVDALDAKKRWASMPLWTLGKDGKPAMLRRQCTREYKIQVVARTIRQELGLQPRQRVKVPVTVWLGISLDEVTRIKPSRIGWLRNAWPLVGMYEGEKRAVHSDPAPRAIRRSDCVEYLRAKGIPVPPKSACIGCPYRSDRGWAYMKKHRADEFSAACSFDNNVRRVRPGVRSPVYLHRSLTPLETVNFGEDHPDMFDDECEGYCGL